MQWTPALASLLGALVGGITVGGTDFSLDRARARRERGAEEAMERREARRASRLLAEELQAGLRVIGRSIAIGRYMWDPPKRQLPAFAWEREQATFATYASDEAWAAVTEAYREFDRLNWQLIGEREEDNVLGELEDPLMGRPLSGQTRAEDTVAKVNHALSLL